MKIGIIGGSGLDDPQLLKDYKEIEVDTPYGKPSSKIRCGKIFEMDVCFLSRHGIKHEIPPSKVNNRANIFALAKLGCTHIIATTAAGSLRDHIKRGDFVIIDQFIDFTRHRDITFFDSFDDGAKHTPMAKPFSNSLREILADSCANEGIRFHSSGTVITIEGPRFSSYAESTLFRNWGADIINMSIAPEVILANEMGLEYAAIAMSTDYDSWKQDEEPVTWEEILRIFNNNSEKMKKVIISSIKRISGEDRNFIKERIRSIPNWPKPGITFRDITPLLADAEGFDRMLKILEERYKNKEFDLIVGIESRGFVIASALASRLKKGIVLVRKPGKLPGKTISEEYSLEYGCDKIEIHADAVREGQKILLVDDLIATGGTCAAAERLIEKLGGKVIECAFIVELPELKGREKIKNPIFKILDFEGD